jgi:spore germination protein GerM
MRFVRLAAALAAMSLLAACGISDDDSPRDIAVADQNELGIDSEHNVGAAVGTARIYLLAPQVAGQAQSLLPVARDVTESPPEVLQALLAGPNSVELARQVRSAVPSDTRLLSARLQGGVLRVDISKNLLQLSGDDLVDAIAQIVFTSSEVEGVQSVKILVEGADQQWPAGNGKLQSEPLTVYDYPGRVASAQPDYPAIPTPSQPG